MATRPWITSDDLITEVKLRIAVPLSEVTYSENDILSFANKEMMDSQVPNIMKYHEEYFVYKESVSVTSNKMRYAIPHRAIGMKLRDLFYKDQNDNLIQMVRINADDQDIYQYSSGTQTLVPYTYYLENNDVCLTAVTLPNPVGSLVFSFFLRPNQLVKNESAAIVEAFQRNVTVDNALLTAGDSISVNGTMFIADTDFMIGPSSIVTATNLVTAVNSELSSEVIVASNSTPATAMVMFSYEDRNLEIESYTTGLAVSSNLVLVCENTIPSGIANRGYVDFLQTKPGHKTYSYGIRLSSTAVSGNAITFPDSQVPEDMEIGDYVCNEYECIIPQVPPDLHSLLIERTCARVLASQGDMEALGAAKQRISEMTESQGDMVDQRVDGSPIKIVNRFSALRAGKINTGRGWY